MTNNNRNEGEEEMTTTNDDNAHERNHEQFLAWNRWLAENTPGVNLSASAHRAIASALAMQMTIAPLAKKGDGHLVVAGTGADGHGVIFGFRGLGAMTRGRLVDIARRCSLPPEWLPMPKEPQVQLTRAVRDVAGDTYNAERELKKSRQVVEAREWTSRWMLVRRVAGEGTSVPQAGQTFGEIALVATLYPDGSLEFDGDEGLATAVRDRFDERVGAERYEAADVTRWINDVHRFHLDAVRYGAGWYVPRRYRQISERITEVFWGEERWGEAWMDPPLPVATSAQLSLGIANGLCSEVDEVLEDLAGQREARRKASDDPKADIGARAAETFMVRLSKVGSRIVAYADVMGADLVENCRERIHDAMVELDAALEGGVSEDWNGIWNRIEQERLSTGGKIV
jgi:hypothetical protein